MDTLFSRHRNAMVLVAVLFLQLVMLAFQVKRDKDVPLIRIWAVGAITPVEKVSSSVIRGVVGVWRDYVDLRYARQENYYLTEELGRLKLSHQRLQEEALEAHRLRELLQFRDELPSPTLAVRVIGSNASETSRVLFLDKGSEAGIRPNMPVITPDGIVGKVHRVFWGTAQVLVITDPDSGVGALLEKSRLHGALRGHGGFFCQLRYIVNDENAEVGERVFTSGEDMIYPKGLPIGVVTSVRSGLVFKEIIVQPSARLNRLEEVLVIVRNVNQEIAARPASPATAAAEGPAGEPTPAAASATPTRTAREASRPAAKPLPAAADSARARPETDADKLRESYRSAQPQKTVAQKPAAVSAGGTAASPASHSAAPSTRSTTPPAAPPKPAAASPPTASPEKPSEEQRPKPETPPQQNPEASRKQ